MLKFGTDGLREKVGKSPLVVGEMVQVGYAIGCYFMEKSWDHVAIGRDTRESGGWITSELTEGLMRAGCAVYDVGVVTTPILAGTVKWCAGLFGGIMVTASHNNCDYNGVKVFDYNGEKLTPKEERMIEKLHKSSGGVAMAGRSANICVLKPYLDAMVAYFGNERPLVYSVLSDSAGGGAHGVVKQAFACFGVECREVGLEPNGVNINESGALHAETLADLMPSSGADLGVALDGDADRVILVDETGRVWNGDRIMAMLAVELRDIHRLETESVVMTEYANGGAMNYLRQNGFLVETVLVGDREVFEKCWEIDAELGSETAGHIIVPSWLSSSDGIFVALMALHAMRGTGRKLSELWPDYEDMPSKQWVVVDPSRTSPHVIPNWGENLRAEEANLQGGRAFVRRSGTEPDKIRVMVEAKSEELCQQVGERLVAYLEQALAKM